MCVAVRRLEFLRVRGVVVRVLVGLRRDRFERALEIFQETGLRFVDDDGARRVRRGNEGEPFDDPGVRNDVAHAVGDVDHVGRACGCDRDVGRRRLNLSGGDVGDQPHLEFLLHRRSSVGGSGTETVCPLSIRGQCPNGRIPLTQCDLAAAQAVLRPTTALHRLEATLYHS